MPVRNIIYLHTHDMGRYISPYGYAVPTPNLERFADDSTLFRKAFCCAPTCSPSRTGLLTGMTPHQAGMLGLVHRGFELSNPERHLSAYLKQNGFETALCGVQHEFEDRSHMSYDEKTEPHQHSREFAQSDRISADAAQAFLRRGHDRPFFLSCGLFYPHRPFLEADPKAYNPDRIQPPTPLPDTPETRKDMADYQASVSVADAFLGQVLDTIHATGRDQDSLVIVTTDHGIAFPKMKCNLTDHGIGVTLMMAYPGNPSARKASDALVSHLDIFPTICDLLGLKPPSYLQGRSMLPLFEQKSGSIRKEIFAEINYHGEYEPTRCIRTAQHKLIRRFAFDTPPERNCDDSPSKSKMLDWGWGDLRLAETELYDLCLDPNEACNLASSPKHQAILNELNSRLDNWMKATADPLLQGEFSRPMPEE